MSDLTPVDTRDLGRWRGWLCMHGCSVSPGVLLEHMKHVLNTLADLQGHMQRVYSAALTASRSVEVSRAFLAPETLLEHKHGTPAQRPCKPAECYALSCCKPAVHGCVSLGAWPSYNKLTFIRLQNVWRQLCEACDASLGIPAFHRT